MKPLRWYLVNGWIRTLEAGYRRYHRLRPVGKLIWLQLSHYRGPERRLADDTRLRPGDPVAVIHFDNALLRDARLDGGHRHGGFVFARLLFSALRTLAEQVERDPELRQATGFYGVTWIPPHGRRLGFEAEPLPDGWRTRMLSWHFRMLLYAFSPETIHGQDGELRPHEFWLSRSQLIKHFATRMEVR